MLRWQRDGLGGVVARIAGSEGLGGAARGELVAFGDPVSGWAGCWPACSMRRSSARRGVARGPGALGLIDATIDHSSAQRAGLACGGQANALVQRVGRFPRISGARSRAVSPPRS